MSQLRTTSTLTSATPTVFSTPLGPATVLPIDLFLYHALPPLKHDLVINEVADRLMRTGENLSACNPVIVEGRWRGFAQDPADMECRPDVAFTHFSDAVSAIVKATYVNGDDLTGSISFKNNPRHTEKVIYRKEGDLPDAYFLSSELPAWANIIASGEYEKTDTEEDREANISKVVQSVAECMNRDVRRRFTFAFTVENTSMRLWYGSRCQIIASQPFNFVTNREPMIHFFLALTYADPSQLGWDMSMSPLGDGRNFDIRLDSLDGTQRIYRTQQLLSCPGLYDLLGKGTRVWKAVLLDKGEPQGEPVILKDAWVDADREIEGNILKYVRALPVNTETHTPMYLEGAFPTTVCHGYVFVDADRTHVDSVRSHFPADDITEEQDESIPPFGLRSSSQHEQSVAPPGSRSRRWWAHYRIVFKEVGKPLSQAQTIPVIFKTLAQIAYALYHLHQGGWVHRDISPGNILIVGDRGTLIDMGYATKFGQGPEYQIGTPGFVPIEVGQQGYLLRWAVPSPKGSKKARSPTPSKEEILRRMLPHEGEELPKREKIVPEFSPEPPFRYNALHDLESLWWVAVYFLIKRRVVDETQDPPTAEDLAALGPQCRLAHQLFEGNEGRIHTVTALGTFAGHGRKLHPSLHRVAILLDQLRQELFTAYVTQEADPLSTDLVPDIHSAFIQTFLGIADAPLGHITLLALPSIDAGGNVILPDVHATRGAKRTRNDCETELETTAAKEPPRKRTKNSRIAPRSANVVQRTRPYLPRKAKMHRTIDRDQK
ncbi:hypothetical protein EIP86_001390 [Pleurotus ostreatoroseus]|nr:hypothetical protein EIP86_001390 [Pleurotus ostreatoroseus]